ncbi:hypothetical protein PR048_014043 [Dryococelus australis]|uniref:Uncharacterized protein n=1 Tax=Dryococelus australis TaxID=614101 RepID=A0ABQ9HU61_9NEOP|nr:hypothetical protein PR048_014043 [Dryococelus australis]
MFLNTLSIGEPKKDEGNLCAAFKFGNFSQDQYDIHQQKKERKEKESILIKLVTSVSTQWTYSRN